ncbi:hypothetical protein EYF80_043072 [Liparis tanakae]|uniref:Uncharacterized protein n=1 Tax=Liparis tanakae TaxID=230148 RepID=A0A4Z2G1C3_9TELE|nr:hypothetical protein EYF80_043072 [Liparis tanakae]
MRPDRFSRALSSALTMPLIWAFINLQPLDASFACEKDAYFMMRGMSSRNSQEARSLFPTERWRRNNLTRLALDIRFSTCFRLHLPSKIRKEYDEYYLDNQCDAVHLPASCTHLSHDLLVEAQLSGLHRDLFKKKEILPLLPLDGSSCLKELRPLGHTVWPEADRPRVDLIDPLRLVEVTLFHVERRDHGHLRLAEKLNSQRPLGRLALLEHASSAYLRVAILEVLIQSRAVVFAARDWTRARADVDPSGGQVEKQLPLDFGLHRSDPGGEIPVVPDGMTMPFSQVSSRGRPHKSSQLRVEQRAEQRSSVAVCRVWGSKGGEHRLSSTTDRSHGGALAVLGRRSRRVLFKKRDNNLWLPTLALLKHAAMR